MNSDPQLGVSRHGVRHAGTIWRCLSIRPSRWNRSSERFQVRLRRPWALLCNAVGVGGAASPYHEGVPDHSPGSPQAALRVHDPNPSGPYAESVAQRSPRCSPQWSGNLHEPSPACRVGRAATRRWPARRSRWAGAAIGISGSTRPSSFSLGTPCRASPGPGLLLAGQAILEQRHDGGFLGLEMTQGFFHLLVGPLA